MLKTKVWLLVVLLVANHPSITAQVPVLIAQKDSVSLRGICAAPDGSLWASGTRGTVARSVRNGHSMEWLTVPGFETRDFRDLYAFDSLHALIMAVDNPAVILKTRNGGKTWQTVFTKTAPGMFLDDMVFNKGSGFCLGDPQDGRLYMLSTADSGNSWRELPFQNRPLAAEGEAFFAASGRNALISGSNLLFVSGGSYSRLYRFSLHRPNQIYISKLPVMQGAATTGANAIAKNGKHFAVAGGNFAKPQNDSLNHAFFKRKGKIRASLPGSGGYKSCVAAWGKGFIFCGTGGVALSGKKGTQWQKISNEPLHTLMVAPGGKTVFLAGPGGKIFKLEK